MKWDRPQKRDVLKGIQVAKFNQEHLYKSIYRPFVNQSLYFDRYWNNCVYQMPQLYPTNTTRNLAICVNQSSNGSGQIALMSNCIADLHFNGDSQCFPRYLYEQQASAKASTLAPVKPVSVKETDKTIAFTFNTADVAKHAIAGCLTDTYLRGYADHKRFVAMVPVMFTK